MPSQLSIRAKQLPTTLRQALQQARRNRKWSQSELGSRVGLPQMHISQIETGRVVPRFDTLLDIVRVLDFDLLLVPRQLVPVVNALIQEQQSAATDPEEQPLYTPDEPETETE